MNVEVLAACLADALNQYERVRDPVRAPADSGLWPHRRAARRVEVLSAAMTARELHMIRLRLTHLGNLMAHLPAARGDDEFTLGHENARQTSGGTDG